ncbi:MAG: PQQ-binding-like beta-propeller repeat protein, partial [Bacteroidales bacterium]|nr:PQQ-binding-like beta-propeller repeat protein [Bacteroidales bacterium]
MKSIVKPLLAFLLAATGLALLGGGIALIAAGGSLYYLAAGAAILASAMLLARGRGAAVALYGAVLLATLIWSLWEVGLNGWALAPRLLFLAALGLLFLLPPVRRLHRHTLWWAGAPAAAGIGVIGLAAVLAVQPQTGVQPRPAVLPGTSPQADEDGLLQTGQWYHWGKTAGGKRYLASDQIDRDNVHQLELAWRYDGDVTPPAYLSFEATPLLADGRLYVCLKPGIVAALDPDTGEQLWRYTAPAAETVDFTRIFGGKCRGVSYFEAPQTVAECPRRIITISPDGYLIALNAADGRLCPGFGEHGRADLHAGIDVLSDGARHEILAMPSSPPAIVNGVAVVGQTIS